MEAAQLLDVVKHLDRQGRLRLYVALGLQLTIRGRGAYSYQSEKAKETLKALNEMMHSLLGHVLALESDSPRTPDEEVSARIFGYAEKLGVKADLSLALDAVPRKDLFPKSAPNN